LPEDLLAHYAGKPLIDKYDVYQHLMDYWTEIMPDDCYLIVADSWKAETYRNFPTALPPTDSDMTAQIFKDPYIFDFLVQPTRAAKPSWNEN
jgi:hypothetical protein